MPMKPIETIKEKKREYGTAEVRRERKASGERHSFGSVRPY